MALTNKLTAIGDAIRAKTSKTDLIPLADMPNKVNDVFDAGKKAEHDAFWDEYQRNGDRVGYNSAFSGQYWGDSCFQPKYDMRPTKASYMFGENNITDLAGILKECGVVLDLSNCTNVTQMFFWCKKITTIPIVDTTATTDDGTNGTFYYLFGWDEKLQSIEKIILKQSGEQKFNGTFAGCYELREIRFEGVIGNDISFKDSPLLTLDSLKSIINHLKDYSGTDKEFTCKLTLASASKTLLENEGATAPNGLTWLGYIQSLGWNA